MLILGIETSCDETSVGIVEKKEKSVFLRSNIVASSQALHKKTGGIIPETAAREQIKYMLPVLEEAFGKGLDWQLHKHSELQTPPIDAIAVTYGPGLIGSLLVGVETAKTLSYIWNKPLIPINHMIGHVYANWIRTDDQQLTTISFPVIALIVSGGHTDLLLLKDHNKIQLLGGTRDDAAGEAFDKIARLLGFGYPGGPIIEKLALKGNAKAFQFPRPMLHDNSFAFSFSGLKTAVYKQVATIKQLNDETSNNIAASVEQAVVDVLVKKTIKAAQTYQAKSILLSGGVAANQKLRETFQQTINYQGLITKFFAPPKNLCTDNGAMIATAGCFVKKRTSWKTLIADPELYF